ncbi:TPA: hypothetical protein ACGIK9_003368 [Acinetobacter baumannii]|uniref:hypothetical protein n=1 Tax=Acinetobacter baumannii TaxID=470 RepID=UPI00338FB143
MNKFDNKPIYCHPIHRDQVKHYSLKAVFSGMLAAAIIGTSCILGLIFFYEDFKKSDLYFLAFAILVVVPALLFYQVFRSMSEYKNHQVEQLLKDAKNPVLKNTLKYFLESNQSICTGDLGIIRAAINREMGELIDIDSTQTTVLLEDRKLINRYIRKKIIFFVF